MEYRLADGSVLTDEDVEREAEAWEGDAWEGDFVEVRLGRPPISREELGTVTFKAPRSRIAAMERRASERGMSKSQFMRDAMERALS